MAWLFLPAIFLLAAYLLLLAYYGRGWRLLKTYKPRTEGAGTRITVIIPARNEEAAIEGCLNSIAEQNYPKQLLEVIVADDFSTDGTAAVVERMAAVYPFIKLLRLANFINEKETNSFKKKGIELAVRHATGELVVTTDADCVAGPGWLAAVASLYQTTGAALIAAPVKMNCGSRFVEIFQALDFLALQAITAGSVRLNFHTMCNGANLAYTKAAFENVNGFAGIDNIASGDDMLLMYKIYKAYPQGIRYLRHPGAIVSTGAQPSWRLFFSQRIRWASKAGHYRDKRVFWALALVYLLNVASAGMLVVPFVCPQYGAPAVMFLAVKCVAETGFLWQPARFYSMQKLLWWFPVCQPFHILYTVIAGFLGKFGRYQWKGRKVQ